MTSLKERGEHWQASNNNNGSFSKAHPLHYPFYSDSLISEYCLADVSGAIIIENNNNQQLLGFVSSDLNNDGTFGLTNSTDNVLQFERWYTCDSSDQPMFLSIVNPVNRALGFASVISGVTNCDQAKLPGWLLFAPSDGNPQGRSTPGKTLTTLHGGWNSPAPFCGENMIWAKDTITGSWKPNWINPGGPIFTGLSLIYDPVVNSIVFASPIASYPNSGRSVPITLYIP